MEPSENLDLEYTDDLVDNLELRWGGGFLSPGGREELTVLLSGVDLTDSEILDIGCGVGGIDVLLVQQHGAKRVLGLDIEQPLLDRATRRVEAAGLEDQIQFQLVKPGPLPLSNESFNIVFSKDAIIHAPDKGQLYKEVQRVLCSKGFFVVGDWYRGKEAFTQEMEQWVEDNGVTFAMETIKEAVDRIAESGFEQVELRDRNDWYCTYSKDEFERIRGPLWPQYVARFGEEDARACVDGARMRWILAEQGQLRPGHIIARTRS